MQLQKLANRFDDRLRIDAFAELDPSANGIQVANRGEINRAAFAVDTAVETIDEAAAADADVLVTHHGVIWDGLERVTGQAYERLQRLITHDIALYVAHLPLDAHPELGNAAGVADVLGLEDREGFGAVGPEYIGLQGTLPDGSRGSAALRDTLESALDTGGEPVRSFAFGPDEVQEVGVVTGSGADYVEEAAVAGLDALVTGEGKGHLYHTAKEAGVTVFLGGHYATETFGVQRLQSLADDWGLETSFVSCPTGL